VKVFWRGANTNAVQPKPVFRFTILVACTAAVLIACGHHR